MKKIRLVGGHRKLGLGMMLKQKIGKKKNAIQFGSPSKIWVGG